MAILNFPATPSVDDTYEENGVLYTWDGDKWTANTTQSLLPITGGELTGDLTVPSLNGGPLAGFRNQIINGDFRIWQRGLTSVGTASRYTADRWKLHVINAVDSNLRRADNTYIAGAPFDYALRYTGADLGTNGRLRTLVELPEAGKFGPFTQGSIWTASFYIENINQLKAAGPMGVSFVDSSTTDANIANFNLVGTLQNLGNNRYAQTFTAPAINSTNTAVQLGFIPEVGANALTIAGVQLEPGPVATPFEHRPYGTELALCQRYFEKGRSRFLAAKIDTGSNYYSNYWVHPFKVTKRARPDVAYNMTAGDTFGFEISTEEIQASGFTYNNPLGGTLEFTFTADAEL